MSGTLSEGLSSLLVKLLIIRQCHIHGNGKWDFLLERNNNKKAFNSFSNLKGTGM
jgi:hypothetical protein